MGAAVPYVGMIACVAGAASSLVMGDWLLLAINSLFFCINAWMATHGL